MKKENSIFAKIATCQGEIPLTPADMYRWAVIVNEFYRVL
jgi:hypothetical protein